jgi:hypothetical protein
MPNPIKKQRFAYLKSAVICLRKQGKTYGEIRAIYKVPKSTISDWLKNLKLSIKTREIIKIRAYERWRINQKKNIQKRIDDALRIRLDFENKAIKAIRKITTEDLRLIGSALYWAEGNLKYRNALRFANSKPEIIQIIMRFFREVCGIPDERIKARVHTHPNINYKKTLKFWTSITKLSKQNFYRPQIQVSKVSQGKRNKNTLPHGTLHINAGNTETTCNVKGWIRGISEQIQ